MLSIFIMFSNDRVDQLQLTLATLDRMKLYDQCQKTLVVDGKPQVLVPGYDTISVPRVRGKFCWSDMWAAGVCSARNDAVLYLDSDRLMSSNYLELIMDNVRDDAFLFTSRHYMMKKSLQLTDYWSFLEDPRSESITEQPFLGSMLYEPRHEQPFYGPGKNVMSGNTAFTKNTFFRLGGVDPWYCGHGAFADSDFHMTASSGGCQFIDLEVPELHCEHLKRDNNNQEISDDALYLMGLDNFIYFCHKWGLPLSLTESVAFGAGVMDARKYVRARLDHLVGKPPGDLAK